MTPLRRSPRSLGRLALLLAALLHLLGAAAGPSLHLRAAERASVEERRGDGPRERPGAPVHDERGCLVCQAHGATALPAGGHLLALAPPSPVPARAADFRAPSFHLPDAPRARGPPRIS